MWGKTSMARATTRAPYSRSSPAQYTLSKTTGMAPASATLRRSGYKTASKAVVTETEPVAPEASTRKDDDYVYIRVPREKGAPEDNGLTETVQHPISQSAGPKNAAPVLHSVPVQLPAPASQQSRGFSSIIPYALVSVLQPGGCDDTSVDAVETEPHLEVLTHHVTGRLAIPGASVADEIQNSHGLWFRHYSNVGGNGRDPQGQPGIAQTALTQAFAGHTRVVTSMDQECDIETQSCSLHLTIETPLGLVRFTMPFYMLPGGGDAVIIGQKTLRENVGIDVMAQFKDVGDSGCVYRPSCCRSSDWIV